MSRPSPAQLARTERRVWSAVAVFAVLIGLAALAAIPDVRGPSGTAARFDASLPNPMGGPAREAPGEPTGRLELGGLRVEGTEVAMGDVALAVTYVPRWDVVNPGSADVEVVVGQPQVLEGCCPGPVYADGQLTQAGQRVTVPAGGSVRLQFPLQMHPGMDGPHHLAVPLQAAGETGALYVTGDCTATAAA
jgi:hypothetical protein